MGFFDNLGKKASAAYDATAEKTGKLAKEAKLRMKINENKSDINDLYKEIGKKVYEKHIREEEYDIKSDLEELCTKIDVISDEIEALLQESLELKDKKQCPKCHTKIEKDDKFCPECGEKQEVKTAKEVEIVEKVEEENKEENEEEKCECSNLEKTVEVESDSKIEEGQTNEQIEQENE